MTTQYNFTKVKAKQFGIDLNMSINGFASGHLLQDRVPTMKPSYFFREDLFLDLATFWQTGAHHDEGMLLYGHAGSGKSSLPAQVAARLNIPVFTLDGTDDTEVSDLLGQWILIDGNFEWIDGPLTLAVRHGGWFILEEVDMIRPQILAALHAIIDGGDLTLAAKGGEVVKRKETFAMFFTANTPGTKSFATDSYTGTNELNLAFLDRISMIEVPYLPFDAELEVLKALQLNIPEATLATMLKTVNDVRTAFIAHESPVTFSTRTALRWVRGFQSSRTRIIATNPNAGSDVSGWLMPALTYSIDRALVFRIPEKEERQWIYDLLQRNFGVDPVQESQI